jgi:cytochrome c-type biogenesis protein CcmH
MSGAADRRGLLPWVLLAGVVAAVVVWVAWPSGEPTDAERVQAVAAGIRCPDCESLSAADSQTISARAIRRDIARRIDEGQSDPTIEQAYADRYGPSILLEPERGGLGLIVWGLPVLFLAVGALVLVVALRRWRGAERQRATDDDAALVRAERAAEAPDA